VVTDMVVTGSGEVVSTVVEVVPGSDGVGCADGEPQAASKPATTPIAKTGRSFIGQPMVRAPGDQPDAVMAPGPARPTMNCGISVS